MAEKKKKKQESRNQLSAQERLRNAIHYNVRRNLMIDPTNLPETHESDAEITRYVLDYQLGLNRDPRAPIPQSKQGYIYLAALQKSKTPAYFLPGPRKEVKTYTLRP